MKASLWIICSLNILHVGFALHKVGICLNNYNHNFTQSVFGCENTYLVTVTVEKRANVEAACQGITFLEHAEITHAECQDDVRRNYFIHKTNCDPVCPDQFLFGWKSARISCRNCHINQTGFCPFNYMWIYYSCHNETLGVPVKEVEETIGSPIPTLTSSMYKNHTKYSDIVFESTVKEPLMQQEEEPTINFRDIALGAGIGVLGLAMMVLIIVFSRKFRHQNHLKPEQTYHGKDQKSADSDIEKSNQDELTEKGSSRYVDVYDKPSNPGVYEAINDIDLIPLQTLNRGQQSAKSQNLSGSIMVKPRRKEPIYHSIENEKDQTPDKNHTYCEPDIKRKVLKWVEDVNLEQHMELSVTDETDTPDIDLDFDIDIDVGFDDTPRHVDDSKEQCFKFDDADLHYDKKSPHTVEITTNNLELSDIGLDRAHPDANVDTTNRTLLQTPAVTNDNHMTGNTGLNIGKTPSETGEANGEMLKENTMDDSPMQECCGDARSKDNMTDDSTVIIENDNYSI